MTTMKIAEATNAIHCSEGVIRQRALRLYFTNHPAAKIKATFFQNVAQLPMTQASPKHPQSLTGLKTAIQSVRGSMKHITAKQAKAVVRRKLPKTNPMPIMNSTAHSRNTPAKTRLGEMLSSMAPR